MRCRKLGSLHARTSVGHEIHHCNDPSIGLCTLTDHGRTVKGVPMSVCATCPLFEDAEPLVSCICPTYNLPERLDALEEAVESFLRQDWPNKELIIICDSDGQIVEFEHPQVKVINSETRFPSLGEKLNFAISQSSGEFVCRFDDDDISLPNRLSSQMAQMKDFDYFIPGAIWYLTGNELEWQKQNGYGHSEGLYRRSSFESAGKYEPLCGSEDAHMDVALRKLVKWKMGDATEAGATYIYRWAEGLNHISGHGANMQNAFRDNAKLGVPGTYRLKPHWNADYLHLIDRARGVSSPSTPTRQRSVTKLCVIGFPSRYGGADTELDHQITVWRAMGVEVHIVPTGEPDAGQLSLGVAERGCIVHKAQDWSKCEGKHVISYCNGDFLNHIGEIRKYARSTTFVNCMCWLFENEKKAHLAGQIDWFLYQTDHARERVEPELRKINHRYNWQRVRPYFEASKFPFVETKDDVTFKFCRVSRDDMGKFHPDTFRIFRDFESPVPKQGTVLGITDRMFTKIGQPPDFVKCIAPGGRPAAEVFGESHIMVQSCDPGHLENLPRVAMEAMASGCVPICDKRGGFVEIIEDGVSGVLCSSPEEFIAAATMLAREPAKRQAMAEAGRRRIEQIYSLEAAAAEWQAFFTKLDAMPEKPSSTDPRYAMEMIQRIEQNQQVYPCIHRGPETRFDAKPPCQGGGAPIFACAGGHGECSLWKYCPGQTVTACSGCSDRVKIEVDPMKFKRAAAISPQTEIPDNIQGNVARAIRNGRYIVATFRVEGEDMHLDRVKSNWPNDRIDEAIKLLETDLKKR